MKKYLGVPYGSEIHDPVDRLELATDVQTNDVYHKGAYYEQWREHDSDNRKWKKALAHWHRLSKDPIRRSSQIRWLRRGVDPFRAQSLLRFARHAKDEPGRWLAMNDLASYGLLDRSCVPTLARVARTDSQDNRMLALHLLSKVEREHGENLYIELLRSVSFRHKITPISCIYEYGSIASVPHVCNFLNHAVRRVRQGEDRDSDVAFAARFLDKFLDSVPVVEDTFKVVIRFWGNLSYEEAMRVLSCVRYIGIRTLEPIPPNPDEQPDRVTINTPGFRRRLWKDKSRFRYPNNHTVSLQPKPAPLTKKPK